MTAILPDTLTAEVQKYSEGKSIIDSLNKALSEWVKLARIRKLNQQLKRQPLQFSGKINTAKVRYVNRSK